MRQITDTEKELLQLKTIVISELLENGGSLYFENDSFILVEYGGMIDAIQANKFFCFREHTAVYFNSLEAARTAIKAVGVKRIKEALFLEEKRLKKNDRTD
jgi:hypothetical protein